MPALRITRAVITPVVLTGLLALPAAADPATKKERRADNARLWATVNVCDTEDNPDTIGLRASMPGTGSKKVRMYMRFRVEYYVAREDEWRLVRKGGDSGWVSVGSGRYVRRESGRSFEFSPESGNILLRGRVSFQWRRGKKVVKRATRRTADGHESSAGADPEDYSAGECLIAK